MRISDWSSDVCSSDLFEPTGILDERLQTGGPNDVPMFRPEDELVVSSVGHSEDSGRLLVENASFSFKLGSRVALLGPGGSGRDELAMLLARLLLPVIGRISIAGRDLPTLPDPVSGRRLPSGGPSRPPW